MSMPIGDVVRCAIRLFVAISKSSRYQWSFNVRIYILMGISMWIVEMSYSDTLSMQRGEMDLAYLISKPHSIVTSWIFAPCLT